MRRLRLGLAGVALLLGGSAFYLLETFEPAPVDPGWAVEGSPAIPAGAVSVRYTGTATLVFSDGDTTWLTDGWFTRIGPVALLTRDIEPDLAAITRGLEQNELESAAAVFPLHSHYDHAMDAPEVARRTGALLLGSESTANIGRGWGLPEDRIRVVRDREAISLGAFTLTPIESRHFEFPDSAMRERALGAPTITEPLVPPVGAFEYRVGKAYMLHVAHPLGTWLIVGSAGFIEGALDGFSADTIFLGAGGLGSQTDAYRETYWNETVERVGATRIIPIHWDSLTGPTEGPFTGSVRAAGFLSGGSDNTRKFLTAKAHAAPGRRFLTLPRFDPVVLYPPAR
jgi:L-ascorbate metabolism protein UlaG (beta-lactamase superfamily)